MSRLVEAGSGAQVLPDVGDSRREWATGWVGQSCLSGDMRTKSKAIADLARQLTIETEESG